MTTGSAYVKLENSFGISSQVIEQDLNTLEKDFDRYKARLREWRKIDDEDLSVTQGLLKSQISRVASAIEALAKSTTQTSIDDESIVENLRYRITNITREFPELATEPAKAQNYLKSQEQKGKRCGVPLVCVITLVLGAALATTLLVYYKR